MVFFFGGEKLCEIFFSDPVMSSWLTNEMYIQVNRQNKWNEKENSATK